MFNFLFRRWEGGIFAAIRNRSLFRRESPALSGAETILWWESRRLPYNLIVGTAGICTCVAVLALALIAQKFFNSDFGLPDPPLFGVILVILYGIMANVCFTLGWVTELLLRRMSLRAANAFAENTFFCGLLFSVILTLSPAVLIGFVGFLKFIHHLKA